MKEKKGVGKRGKRFCFTDRIAFSLPFGASLQPFHAFLAVSLIGSNPIRELTLIDPGRHSINVLFSSDSLEHLLFQSLKVVFK